MRASVMLQAHRGLASEYPENTMSALAGAAEQGYDIIELDPNVTLDGKFVLLHDNTINRTARMPDGSAVEGEIKISEITRDEAMQYDFGLWFSKKFRGERIPLMEDVLRFAEETGIVLKIDNKIQQFSAEHLRGFFSLLQGTEARLAFTCSSLAFARTAAAAFPEAELHYDGEVNAEILEQLRQLAPAPRLTVWLPYQNAHTAWVKVLFADEALCALVKRYGRLGIWLISDDAEFADAAARYRADVVETDGRIKPEKNMNKRVDMHTHSKNSHDSVCDVADMGKSEAARGVGAFAVTDHCDVLYCRQCDVAAGIKNSVRDAIAARAALSGTVSVLTGIEFGEGAWYPEETARILHMEEYDVVIGSVHTVKYDGYDLPYSQIDFSAMPRDVLYRYLDAYFDDVEEMLETVPCDVLGHLTGPLRYINGRYGLDVDCRRYELKIRRILQYIIGHAVALEINTSNIGGSYSAFMPEEWIIKLFKALGGYLITVGSDAHTAARAANGFDEAYAFLKACGYKNCYYFKGRRPVQCTIE